MDSSTSEYTQTPTDYVEYQRAASMDAFIYIQPGSDSNPVGPSYLPSSMLGGLLDLQKPTPATPH